MARDVIFCETHFPFYKDKTDTNLDKPDPFKFKHFLPSISDNDISFSDIVPLVFEKALSSSTPVTDSLNPLHLTDTDIL